MHVFVFLSVERKSASFGEVRVYWRVLRVRSNGSTSEIPQGQEFVEVMGFVTFTSGLESQTIGLTPIEDGIAELDETFELRLINATGKFLYLLSRDMVVGNRKLRYMRLDVTNYKTLCNCHERCKTSYRCCWIKEN